MGWLSALAKIGLTAGAGAVGGPLASAAVGGAMSGLEAQNKMKEQQRQNRAKAEANRYSDLTGNWQGMQQVHNNVLGATLGGAIQSGLQAKAMGLDGTQFSGGVAKGATGATADLSGGAVQSAVPAASAWQQTQQAMQAQPTMMANPYNGNPYGLA